MTFRRIVSMHPLPGFDPWLVRVGRIWIRPRGGRLCRLLATLAVDEVEALSLVVIGSRVLVGERPSWRDPAVMMDLAEVALPQRKRIAP